MKKIPLTQGKFALVDDADFEYLNQWGWIVSRSNNKFYACRRHGIKEGGRGKIITMHRVIMEDSVKGLDTDHIDGNGLNNQRSNLRACTRAENVRNRRKPSVNNELYTGIKKYSGVFKTTWRAIIGHDGTVEHLGQFPTPEAAARAYDQAAKKYFGEFARLNFPEQSQQLSSN
jgi:hypothetical protein